MRFLGPWRLSGLLQSFGLLGGYVPPEVFDERFGSRDILMFHSDGVLQGGGLS